MRAQFRLIIKYVAGLRQSTRARWIARIKYAKDQNFMQTLLLYHYAGADPGISNPGGAVEFLGSWIVLIPYFFVVGLEKKYIL